MRGLKALIIGWGACLFISDIELGAGNKLDAIHFSIVGVSFIVFIHEGIVKL